MPLCRELGIGFLAYRWIGHRVHACVIMHVLSPVRLSFVASLAPASWLASGQGVRVCVAIVHVNGTCLVGIAWCMYREPRVMLTHIAELVQEVAAAPGPECTVLRLRGTCGLAARWAAGCSRAR